MLATLKHFFAPPTFDDPEINLQARNLHTIVIAILLLTGLYLIYTIATRSPVEILVAAVALAAEIGILALIQKNQVRLASYILTTFLWIAVFVSVINYGGIRDTGFAAFTAVVIIAGLTMGIQAGYVVVGLSLVAATGLAAAENQGLLAISTQAPISSVLVSHAITLSAVALLLSLAVNSISAAAQRARDEEQLQKQINLELEESRRTLEQYTGDLENRTTALQAVAELTRLASQANSEAVMLESGARLIAERLEYAHVGIFITDATDEYAILCASNSEAGQSLIAEGYKLQIGRGELAYLISGTELLRYRIGEQTYRVASPIPILGVQGNVTYPLIAGNRLLGLLNIQTATPSPTREEQNILQTFADQLAISIENIRLLAQLQERLREISALAGRTVQQAWENVRAGGVIGYQYDRLQLLPGGQRFPPQVLELLAARKVAQFVVRDPEPRARLIAPLILRDEVIGILGYEDDDPAHEWLPEEITLLETVSFQVSLALENSRLVSEAQDRADREQTVSEIVSRISTEIDVDAILQSTVREIGRLVGDSEIAVQLQTPQKG
ncbi:MAG: GAF domain-containing protein [Anaerolineales bacterium]|nr:GAF domain-containing protein [Anaerolineales bacterium]